MEKKGKTQQNYPWHGPYSKTVRGMPRTAKLSVAWPAQQICPWHGPTKTHPGAGGRINGTDGKALLITDVYSLVLDDSPARKGIKDSY